MINSKFFFFGHCVSWISSNFAIDYHTYVINRFMKKLLLPLVLGWFALASAGQIVTTSPAIVQTDSKNIVITYHADEGNKGLAGLTATSKVYAHTGVITSESSGPGDWKHAPDWLDNSSKYEMTYAGADTWTLTIPDLASYYGLSAGETVDKLMFVFRNATGSMEGKTASGGDISVDVYPPGFQVVIGSSLESSVINSSDPVYFTVNTTAAANIRLYLQGASSDIASASSATTLSGSMAFTSVGAYTIVAEATPVAGGSAVTSTLQLVKLGASVRQDYPGGIPKMGPVTNADGSVTFCIAAPGKSSMVLVPSWNGYQITSALQMKYHDYEGYRYFWTTVSDLRPDTDYIYYFLADGETAVGDPYARLVLDPWSDKYIPESVFPDMPAYPVGSVPEGLPLAVYNSGADDYDWQVTDFKGVDKSRLVIYELLIRDFTGEEGEANGSGTVAGVLSKLDYLESLGVNAIELMPVMEFNGNNSWGYNTNFYFAPDKAYGTPDDYRRLIDECHARGIAVILDIVFNQSDGLHPWYQLYSSAENPFYNASAPHAYSVLNDWKQENPLVEMQWKDALQYWLSAYKVDGFRFDLVKGLGDSDSYGAVYNASTNTWSGVTDEKTNLYNQTRVDRMKRLHDAMREVNPDAYFINENLAGAEEENAMAADGELNWANINTPSTNYELMSDADLNVFYAPSNGERKWGSTVSYMESHDEERIAYAIENYSGSVSNVLTIKNSEALRNRRLGSIAAQMLLSPGPHMIWQFQEFGDNQTTKNASGNDTSPKTVVWNDLENEYQAGLKQSYADLINIRNSYPEFFTDSISTEMNCNFNTITAKTIVLTNGDKQLVLVVNPNYRDMSSTMTLPESVSHDYSDYKLLAASYGQTPKMTSAKKVSLKGCSFAVFGTNNLVAGIDDIASDSSTPLSVYADSEGNLIVDGEYSTLAVYDLSGRPMPTTSLLPGIYIVRVDATTHKIAVTR